MNITASNEQLQELLVYCIDFGKQMLLNSGEFYPFGASLNREGNINAVGAYDGKERPNPHEIYKLMGKGFDLGISEGKLLGVAIAANVNIPQEYSGEYRDGIRVHLETTGYSRYVYWPYRLKREGFFRKKNILEFEEPFSVTVPPNHFLEQEAQ